MTRFRIAFALAGLLVAWAVLAIITPQRRMDLLRQDGEESCA